MGPRLGRMSGLGKKGKEDVEWKSGTATTTV